MNNSNQDPWTWGEEDIGVEDTQRNEFNKNRWNTSSTSVTYDPKKTKDISNEYKYTSNSGPDYFDSINVRNMSHQVAPNWTQSGDIPRNSIHYPPQPNTANYFNNNNNKSNNNGQIDVENKEVAPPDNQFNRRQPPLFKDNQLGRHPQEQKAFSSQINKSAAMMGSSGASSLAASFFDPNQFSGPKVQQENTFPNSSINTFYPDQNTLHSPANAAIAHSSHSSVFFTSQADDAGNTTKQNIASAEILTQKQTESNNSVNSISSHFVQNSRADALLPSSHVSSNNSFPTKSNNPPFFPSERSNFPPSLFPAPTQSAMQFFDGPSESKTSGSHELTGQTSSDEDKGNVNAVMPGNEISFPHILPPSHSSGSSSAEQYNQNSLYSKQEDREANSSLLTTSLQSTEHVSKQQAFINTFPSSHQPPAPNQGSMSQPPSNTFTTTPQQPLPSSYYQQPFQDTHISQYPLVSNQNSNVSLASNQTSTSNDANSVHSFTSHHYVAPQHSVPYQQPPFSYQPTVSQQPTISHQTNISQQPSLPNQFTGSQQPPISQPSPLSTISQQSDLISHQSSAASMPTSSYPPPQIPQAPSNSYHSLPLVPQPPQNSHAPPLNTHASSISHPSSDSYQSQPSQNSQAPPINTHAPPLSQLPPPSIPYQPPAKSHQSEPPSSNHQPVSHPPSVSQPPPTSHPPPPQPMPQQPPVPQQRTQISNQPPIFNKTLTTQQQSFSALPPISYQQTSSNQQSALFQNMTSQNYEGTLTSFSQISFGQESTLSNSQKVVLSDGENVQNDHAKELTTLPLDVNPTSISGLSSLPENDVHNKGIDVENSTQVRYSPSPQQTSNSRTPPDVPPYSQNSQIPQNNTNSIVFSRNVNLASENTFENDPNNYSRDQISFNFRNVQPMASSSPAPVQNIPENQERLPENHEMPDNTENLLNDMKKLSINKEEVVDTQTHCQVDRNQYLETGHLSGSKDHILTDNSPNVEAIDESEAPPPGLHRLVTGQGCEMTSGSNVLLMGGGDSSEIPDTNRHSSPASSTAGSDNRSSQRGAVGESEAQVRTAGRLVQGQSIGDDTDGGVREVPGEATPFNNRIVLGQMGRNVTPPLQDGDSTREREIVGRMVVGERYDRDISQNVSSQDEFRQPHRSLRRSRRGESSYEDEDHDYSSDRDRRVDEYKRRGDDRDRVRHRSRREHRSPEYRSDEDFEDRHGFSRMGRGERRRRRYDNYREYDDDYYYRENRSRPLSRTGSDYRRNNIDYMGGRVPRHMFYPDMGAIPFNPRAPEEYYEAMRRLDPMGYAAWYNQYMSSRYNQQAQASFNNDRASVHSGQSSTNNRTNVETPQAGVEDIGRDDEEPVHASAHIKGIIDNQGRLIVIDPHYPIDNQRPTVNIYQISNLPSDPDIDEFLESPGPFVPGVTHRNTVLQYLKLISDRSTKSSEKLLYDLIHLSVKSNGELNGLDVADLLMESYKRSQIEEGAGLFEVTHEQIATKDALNKFRELLQQGNKTEALEWAIDHGAWGHALFLASKMDERTHNTIMLRFANSIPHTDPLQTLYQLMSGHVPQASTCCADKKWSDWRPHLAMILGNPTGNRKLDRKAIIKLGDSLFAKGRIFASHFCYITAQADFTSYDPDAKLVLLGSNPNQKFGKFATCRAIMVTICYEYGLKLRQANANIPSLQLYKLILALRLIDNGKSKIALQYCELIANEALKSNCCERVLIATLIDLSSKLKMLDPTLTLTGDVESDPDWLARLKTFYNNLSEDYDAGLMISHGVSTSSVSDIGQETNPPQDVEINADTVNIYGNDPVAVSNSGMEFSVLSVPPGSQQAPMQPLLMPTSVPSELVPDEIQQPQQQTYQPNSMPPPLAPPPNNYNAETYAQQPVQNTMDPPYWTPPNTDTTSSSYTQQETVETANVSNSKNNFFKASEEQLKLNEIRKENNRSNSKATDSKPSKSDEAQHSGWFGGIWEKLSIRPKNQMRLPDDNNPSIVWDEQKKRWVNRDGDNDSTPAVKPPPRMTETVNKTQPILNESLPSNIPSMPPATGNKYKIQKGKLMKSNYVNIMGTTNNNQQNSVRPMDGLFPTVTQPNNTNYFVPPPAEGNEYPSADLINTGHAPTGNKPQTDFNAENKQDFPQGITAPAMYNPSRYPISNDC